MTCGIRPLGHRNRQFFNVNELLVLWNRLAMSKKGLEMSLDGFANVSLGFFNGFAIAIAPRQSWAVGQMAGIFGFFFGDNLECVILHSLLLRARV